MIDGIIPYDWKSMKAPIESEDKRIASMVRDLDSFNVLHSGDIVIIGIPQDIGVARNGGRIGASKAPFKIREYLGKLSIHGIVHFPNEIYDIGNIICEGRTLEDIRVDHQEIIQRILETGAIPIILGGGHDIAFPNAKALLDTHEHIGIINIDPHLDVRVKIDGLSHSGTPFREMLEYKKPDIFLEFGTQTFTASTHHREFVEELGGNITSYEHLRSVGNPSNEFGEILKSMKHEELNIYVSFDMDAVSSAFAPGVSAPATIGFTSDEITEMAYWAGAQQVRMIDIVEVNPEYDIDDRTSRLAALMIAQFIAGYASGS
jgi:formiminoglutamase